MGDKIYVFFIVTKNKNILYILILFRERGTKNDNRMIRD